MKADLFPTLRRISGPAVVAVLVTCAAVNLPSRAAETADPATWTRPLEPFLRSHCADCHGDGADEGGFSFDDLKIDLSNAETFAVWERVFDRVEKREMPPEEVEQPGDDERSDFIGHLTGPLTDAHEETKSTVLRRLNRAEYENTLNDLFGTHLNLQSLLPEDGRSGEFDNIGRTLGVSMVHLQQYIEAIDLVLDASIAKRNEAPEPDRINANYADSREGQRFLGDVWKQLNDGAVVFYQDFGYPTGMLRDTGVDRAGRYKIRITGYAHQSERPITFFVGGSNFQPGSDKPTYGYFELPPGPPSTIEFEAWVDRRFMITVTPWGLDTKGYNIRKDGVDGYTGPGLAINRIELEGPLIDQFPSRGHELLFQGIDRVEIEPDNPRLKERKSYVGEFEIRSNDPVGDARRVLRRIATKAFRGEVSEDQLVPYVRLFESQRDIGASVEEALRTATSAIFCAPDFLYFQERDGRLTDDALATRLSYFLTRTTPDDELIAVARQGRLTDGSPTLLRQTRRLIGGERFPRFVNDFTDAWLNLRDIHFTSPDQQLFPEYDRFLEDSMIAETRAFFSHVVQQNLSTRQFIDADFAMLNNRLALHYGIDGVEGPEIRAVQIPKAALRGELLTQASVLKVSANGTNTSPVVRGVYVTERLIGQTPSPPPPGVPGVEPDIRGASTLRDLLDKHRNLESCRSCHQLIDPPGFALECFNPIGGYRDRYRSLGEGEKLNKEIGGRKVRYRLGPPVDASGQLADGGSFDGYSEFRDLLAADEDLIARTLTVKLLTFATGREMGFSDRPIVDRIVAQSRRRDHRFRELIESIVESEIFQNK